MASALGEELAPRGHEVHFICYDRPFRMPENAPMLFFHRVAVNNYGLFKHPDYLLPLSVEMAKVSTDYGLDVLHVHYAVPHATAAILACSMLPAGLGNELMIFHSSNLRPLKRIDLLLETVALFRPRESFKLVVVAGGDFSPYMNHVHRFACRRKRNHNSRGAHRSRYKPD